jgi:hypothetical protein
VDTPQEARIVIVLRALKVGVSKPAAVEPIEDLDVPAIVPVINSHGASPV